MTNTHIGSPSRQSSSLRSQARQTPEHGYESRGSASSSSSLTSSSDASWTTGRRRQVKYHSRATTEKPKARGSDDGFDNGANRCGCSHRAALFLVELGQINARMEHGSLDMLLGHFREGLGTFGALIECEQCISVSESNVVAARCLGMLCENVVKSYIGTMTMGPDYARESLSRTANEMWYSNYNIHDEDERQEVLRCIVSVQVSQLRSWLEKLKARTSNSRKHAFLMSEVESKVAAVACMLNKHSKQG